MGPPPQGGFGPVAGGPPPGGGGMAAGGVIEAGCSYNGTSLPGDIGSVFQISSLLYGVLSRNVPPGTSVTS